MKFLRHAITPGNEKAILMNNWKLNDYILKPFYKHDKQKKMIKRRKAIIAVSNVKHI